MLPRGAVADCGAVEEAQALVDHVVMEGQAQVHEVERLPHGVSGLTLAGGAVGCHPYEDSARCEGVDAGLGDCLEVEPVPAVVPQVVVGGEM